MSKKTVRCNRSSNDRKVTLATSLRGTSFCTYLSFFLGPRVVSAMLKLVTASPGFSRTVLHFMDVLWI